MSSRIYAVALSLLISGAVFAPIVENWRDEPRDSFPLSHYPMFSKKRPRVVQINYLLGLDANGVRHKIPYSFAGRGGLNQVRRQINKRVRKGEADKLCQRVSKRLAGKKGASLRADVVTIQVVTGRYDMNRYFTGLRVPVSEKVQASCSVKEGAK